MPRACRQKYQSLAKGFFQLATRVLMQTQCGHGDCRTYEVIMQEHGRHQKKDDQASALLSMAGSTSFHLGILCM